MKWRYLPLWAFLGFLNACQQQKPGMPAGNGDILNLPEIVLEPGSNETGNIFGLIEDLRIIPITNNDSAPFATIVYGKKTKSHYIFSDGPDYGNLVITDFQGNVIRKINKMGDGPEEYRAATCFSVNKNPELITVYDFQRQRMIEYDLKGNFIRDFKIGYYFLDFAFHSNHLYMFTGKHENVIGDAPFYSDILVADTGSFQLSGSYLPFNSAHYERVRLHRTFPFFRYNDEVWFSDVMLDTVYSITGNKITPRYLFKYEGRRLPAALTENGDEHLINKLQSDAEYLKGFDFGATMNFINDEFVLYSYISSLKKYFGVYFYKSGRKKEFTFNNPDLTYHKILDPFFEEGNYMVSVIPLYTLDHVKKQLMSLRQKSYDQESLINYLSTLLDQPEDAEQPVIIKYKIKVL